SSDKLKKKTCNYGAKKLSNPVKDTSDDGDLSTNSQSKGDSRVDMTTRNVCSN
ncbi:hypothetical protein A2U01_0109169, partial [Trifolium medium]|nr:hypothetical protein [Trifolium medium]